jgi:hypothetical protein
MVRARAKAETSTEANGTPWKAHMTREEKEQAADEVLSRYEQLGATIVGDDVGLCRLLRTLEFSSADKDVGEYLCSFLTA